MDVPADPLRRFSPDSCLKNQFRLRFSASGCRFRMQLIIKRLQVYLRENTRKQISKWLINKILQKRNSERSDAGVLEGERPLDR